MSGIEVKAEGKYSTDPQVDALAGKVVRAVEMAGGSEPNFGDLKVAKMRGWVNAMKASESNGEHRFKVGNMLRTYVINKHTGEIEEEVKYGRKILTDKHTIYKKRDPLFYGSNHPDPSKRGFPVMGHFEEDGTFTEDPMGSEQLHNEYATDDVNHPVNKYGITPVSQRWQDAFAKIPSYLVEIPAEIGKVTVISTHGTKIEVSGGDFVVVDDFGGGKIGVQAIERSIAQKTYSAWEDKK